MRQCVSTVTSPLAIAGRAFRLILAASVLLGAAADEALAASAGWLTAPAQHAVDDGFFHSHAAGELPHWHPFPVEPEEPAPPKGPATDPGYAPSHATAHDHPTHPSTLAAVATLSLGRPVPSRRLAVVRGPSQCIAVPAPLWRAIGARGPPLG